MTKEVTGKKINDLRVCDLKSELEKRGLETSGIKIALLERLQKAIVDEGKTPDEVVFEIFDKNALPVKRARPLKDDEEEENADADENQKEENTNENIENVENDEAAKSENMDNCVVDSVGEVDDDQDHIQLTMADAENLETSNVDNEDSLNLTIGEDEAKIFQDQEEIDEKIKAANNKKEKKSGDTAKNSTSLISSGNGDKNNVSTASKSFNIATDDNDNADDKSGKNISDASKSDDKSDSTGNNKKSDDSDSKTSTKSSKDDKESSKTGSNASGNGANSKSSTKSSSSSSSSSSASRNLWVSGLSSLTRATDLKIIFSKFGKVIGAKVVTNTRTPGTRCYGYVTMNSSSDAAKCISHLHRTELHGRIISVERAKSDMGGIGSKAKSTDSKKDDSKSSSGSSDRKKTASKDETSENANVGEKSKESNGSKPSSKRDEHGAATVTADSSTDEHGKGKKCDSANRDEVRKDRKRSNSRSQRSREPSHKSTNRGEVLSFQKIREERERQRLRERERKLREEERRRTEARRRQREEEERLARERERLKKERIRLEREKADLLRLERERQKLEREKIELERLELKRQQLKIEEEKRAIKRPAAATSGNDRYEEIDRKRSTNDRRFEPPPPPRFDTAIRSSTYDRTADKKRIDDYTSSSKRNDDYKTSSRGSGASGIGNADSFKRTINDYAKRDIDPPRNTSGGYDQRGAPSLSSSGKDHRFNDSVDNRGGTFGRNRVDDRDSRGSLSSNKSRYMDNGNSNDRYSDRQSSSTTAWGNLNNAPPSSVKPFGGMASVTGNDPWNTINKPPQADNGSWNRMEHQNQDRYDRTYNERKTSSQYIEGPGVGGNSGRPSSFIANNRPQDRFSSNSMSSRFDGRY